jgi:hypothetical protein
MTSALNDDHPLRELSADDISVVAGGAINLDFEFVGIRIMIRANDDYAFMCVANSDTYTCSGAMADGTPISGSGPVPR